MVSSIAAAGLYKGTFPEDMFDEAEKLENHPYFQTKHESEAVVREESEVPWRVYRPGIVVGHSETGEMDKIDGPYYFFKLIQRLRNALPPWVPGVGIEGGKINIVPVDFVAKAMDHIAHHDGLDGQAFHLTDPKPLTAGQVINVFAKAAHAPRGGRCGSTRRCSTSSRKQVRSRPDDAAAGEADHRPGARRPRHPARGARLHQLPDRLRLDQDADGARGDRHLGPAARRATRTGSGTTGSATSTPTCSRTARSPGRDRGQGRS